MTTSRRSLALVVVVLVGAVAGPPAGSAGASVRAWAPGACPTADGVTVVVDFQALGGGTVTRCAIGVYDDGFAALMGAGFSVEEPRNTPNFVCRIDGAPGVEAESCIDTPRHTSYWSYWRAKRGGSWVYGDVGAGSTGTAKPGSVQGWSFSDGSNPPPRVAPPSAAPVVTAPPATAPPATAPLVTAPSATAGPGSGGPSATLPGARPTGRTGATPTTAKAGTTTGGPAPTAPGATTTVAPGSPADPGVAASTTAPAPDASVMGTSEVAPTTASAPSPAAGGAAERTIELASSRGAGDDAGSPIGTLLAVGVVGAIAGAAFVVRRRRG